MLHIIVSTHYTMSSESSSVTSAPVRLTGRVKWFNNKTGFGFISVVGGNDQYKDASEIFVHHSAVAVSQEQYRYLVEGEYVEFSVVTSDGGVHKFQAGDVRGVKGGKLFCETRRERVTTHEADGGGSGSGSGGGGSGGRYQDNRGARGGHSVRGGYVARGGRGGGGSSRGNGRDQRDQGDSRDTRDGREGGEWMLVRRGRPGEHDGSQRAPYRPRQERFTEKHHDRESSGSVAPPPPATTSSVPTPTPAPVSVSASASTSDVPATPRASATKKPRQSKPVA